MMTPIPAAANASKPFFLSSVVAEFCRAVFFGAISAVVPHSHPLTFRRTSLFLFPHGHGPDLLRSRLNFEYARLLGEMIDALAGRLRGLLVSTSSEASPNS